MPIVTTDAVVLHGFDYLETSRILRLATREAGVQSVLARGARRSRSRFGMALDLFAGGVAEIHLKAGRDLQSLASFDVSHARTALADDLDRFVAASALAELMLRFAGDDAQESLFDALIDALDAIAGAPAQRARETALSGAWRLVAELGFAPSVDRCASCHADVAPDLPAPFSHPHGGVLCPRCAPFLRASRTLPATGRASLRGWVVGERGEHLSDGETRAHQRLLREFLQEHLTDGRPLRAYDVWERGSWIGT